MNKNLTSLLVVLLHLSCKPDLEPKSKRSTLYPTNTEAKKDGPQDSSADPVAEGTPARELINTNPNCDDTPNLNSLDIGTPYPAELASTDFKGAKCLFNNRRKHVTAYLLEAYKGKIPNNAEDDNRSSFNSFIHWAIPALTSNNAEAIAQVDKALVESEAKSWNYGSSFDLGNIGGVACSRKGDYDFVAFNIAALGLLGKVSQPPLSEAAQRKISSWLPLSGKAPEGHKLEFKMEGALCGGLGLSFPETENHIIMTQVARYLTNQLKSGKNEPAFDNWMIKHMSLFLENYFDEYNSRPYQTYAIQPIMVLGALAASIDVQTAARNVLQMVMAVQASQSNGYRRFSPFRRQPQYKNLAKAFDGERSFAPLVYFSGKSAHLVGYAQASDKKKDPIRGDQLLASSLLYDKNFLSDVVLDLILSEDNTSYSQRYQYDGNEEVYASTPNYLISAAGRFHKYEKCPETTLPFISECTTDQQHGFATKTMVIPSKSMATNVDGFLHFQGHPIVERRNNTCVGKDFLCGLAPTIPEAYSSCPKLEKGNWIFYDLNSSDGECKLGFFAGIRKEPCSGGCPNGVEYFGIMHLLSSPEVTLNDFAEKVSSANSGPIALGKSQEFNSFAGEKISYTLLGKNGSSFVLTDKNKKWASGDIVNAENKEIVISAPRLNQSIRLPFKD